MSYELCAESSAPRLDPGDVLPNRFTRLSLGDHELGIVGLAAPEIIDHQIPSAGLDSLFELLDRCEQINQVFRPLPVAHIDAPPAQSIDGFQSRRRTFFDAVRIETQVELVVRHEHAVSYES